MERESAKDVLSAKSSHGASCDRLRSAAATAATAARPCEESVGDEIIRRARSRPSSQDCTCRKVSRTRIRDVVHFSGNLADQASSIMLRHPTCTSRIHAYFSSNLQYSQERDIPLPADTTFVLEAVWGGLLLSSLRSKLVRCASAHRGRAGWRIDVESRWLYRPANELRL